MERFVVISSCSGGGKSTLLAELGRRGHSIVEEPGRRIVREEPQEDELALPWKDARAFARRAITMALEDRTMAATLNGWVFFDRGLVDAAAALQHRPSGACAAASALVRQSYRELRVRPFVEQTRRWQPSRTCSKPPSGKLPRHR